MKKEKFRNNLKILDMKKSTLLFLLIYMISATYAQNRADRYWSGNSGSSDNIDQENNWYDGVNPSSGDNLYFNNTLSRHWAYSNYATGSYFGNIITYSGAGGIKLYGDNIYAYKFENNNDPSLLELSPSSAGEGSKEIGNRVGSDLEINPVGDGGILVSCDRISIDNSGGAKSLKIYGDKNLTIEGYIHEKNGSGAIVEVFGNSYVTIKGNSTHTGSTTLNAGTLELQGSLSTSAVTVKSGATLKINGDAVTVASLTVESGGNVEIVAGKSLTVSGALSNNGTFTIKSDATGTGSLKTNGTVSGSITAQRYFGGSNWDWHLLSSPVTDQAIQNEFVPATFTPNEDFYCYHEPTSEWVNYKNSTTPPTWATANGDNTFVEGKGYLVSYNDNSFTKSFTGIPNTGSQSFTLSNEQTAGDYIGVNLAGNPYPSSIDWKAASGWTRTDLVNTNTSEAPQYDMYIWNPAESNYGVYNSGSSGDNGTNSVTRYIPPMQGFFVNAATNGGSMTMTNDVRVHNNASNWLKNGVENSRQFRVVVNSVENYGTDEVVIETGHEASAGGALKMFSFVESAPSLYLPKENKNYSISFLQDVPAGTTIPLYFGAGIDGQYELVFNFDFQLYANVKLTDKKTGIISDITENSVYQFFSAKDDSPDRFLLHFGVVGMGEQDQAATLHAYAYNNRLYVNNSLEQAQIAVYDLQGRLLMQQSANTSGLQSLPLDLPAGVYVVRLSNAQEAKSVKINVQ